MINSSAKRFGIETHYVEIDTSELQAKQVEVVYAQTPITLWGGLLTALMAMVLLWSHVRSTFLIIWCSSIVLLTITRLCLSHAYESSPSKSRRKGYWLTWHLLGTTASGIAWGLVGVVITPANDILPQIFAILLVSGFVAAAIGPYAVELRAYFCFVAPASTLLASHLFLRADSFGTAAGSMFLVFVGVMALFALRLNKMLLRALEAQFVKSRLVSQLNTEKNQLERLKNELERRVAERTATLETINRQLEGEITRSADLTKKLSYQATHDALTDLINRREFERRLHRVLQSAHSDKTNHVLCYLDLDQFKVVNDTCGHLAGDELLRQLPGIFRQRVRKRDTVARLGGDEFGILMEHCSLEQAKHTARALRRAVQDFRFVWEDKSFNISVSMGVVPIDCTSGTMTDMLKQADAACYEAKDKGRNRIHFVKQYDAELVKRSGEIQWVSRIERALEEDRFNLAFQSIWPLASAHRGEHYELLLRMADNGNGVVFPGVFIPAAERYCLMVKLDRWVVRTAFEALSRCPTHLSNLYQCSINLSGHSLGDEEFLNFVIQQFRRTEIPPHKICFEITETAAIANLHKGAQFMKALRELGCQFALDDFGSGLSSFAYLKGLPVDYLKIDGLFIKDVADDPIAFSMVKSIHEIGQVMGKKTIAEYVLNANVLEKLREIGVNYAQGYGIAPPQPTEELWRDFAGTPQRVVARSW